LSYEVKVAYGASNKGGLAAPLSFRLAALNRTQLSGSALRQRAWLIILWPRPVATDPLVAKPVALNPNAGSYGTAAF